MIVTVRGSRKQMRKAMQYRAILNGKDVTDDCFFADDRGGRVRVFARDSSDRFYILANRNEPAWAERRGKVRLERKA